MPCEMLELASFCRSRSQPKITVRWSDQTPVQSLTLEMPSLAIDSSDGQGIFAISYKAEIIIAPTVCVPDLFISLRERINAFHLETATRAHSLSALADRLSQTLVGCLSAGSKIFQRVSVPHCSVH